MPPSVNLFSLLILTFFINLSHSQNLNLVLNPDFKEYKKLPYEKYHLLSIDSVIVSIKKREFNTLPLQFNIYLK